MNRGKDGDNLLPRSVNLFGAANLPQGPGGKLIRMTAPNGVKGIRSSHIGTQLQQFPHGALRLPGMVTPRCLGFVERLALAVVNLVRRS